MGCGSSSSKALSTKQKPPEVEKNGGFKTKNADTQSIFKESSETNGLNQTTNKNQYNKNDKQITKPNINPEEFSSSLNQENSKNLRSSKKNDTKENRKSLSKNGVAFEVKFNEDSRVKELRPPPRLQKLENITVLTAEMLAKKQAIAEKNRQKEIQRRLAKTSKRKKQLLEAREIDKAQEKLLEIENKMTAKETKRAKLQAEIIEKQRRREKRAQLVRAKAESIRGEDMVDFDVDQDTTYNADEGDETWETERTDKQLSNGSQLNSKSQLEDQVESKNGQHTTDSTEQSVYDFFEE